MNTSTHMRKVAVFRHDLLPVSETFIRAQVKSLRNWQAVLVGRRLVGEGLRLDGIPIRIIPGADSTYGQWLERLEFWLKRPIQRLVRTFESLDVGLVHAHFGTDATDIWPSVKAAGLPMLVTLHGYDINIHKRSWESGYGGLRRRVYPGRLLWMARDPSVSFIAASNALKLRAVEAGIPREKIRVAYIGVDTRRFTPGKTPLARRRPRILFVGRMVESKGPLLLIRAFATVRKFVPNAELAMVGAGPLLEACKREATRLGLPVSFSGPATSDEVLAHIREAKVLCLPSIPLPDGASEGLGQVLLEAQSCGVPVVGSNIGGIPEAIHPGVTGQIFPPGDEAALAECLKLALCSPEHRLVEIAAECRNWMQSQFDLSSMTSRLEELYDATQKT